MNKPLKIVAIGCGALAALAFIVGVAVFILIARGPDTSVYAGRQIPKRFMATIRSLDLLEPGEEIRYFYSDALLDITEGLYFVTDRNLVLYARSWEEPKTIIPFEQIASLDAEYNESFLEDSSVFVVTTDGTELSFPLSSEKGLDRKFVAAIQEKLKIKPATIDDPDSVP